MQEFHALVVPNLKKFPQHAIMGLLIMWGSKFHTLIFPFDYNRFSVIRDYLGICHKIDVMYQQMDQFPYFPETFSPASARLNVRIFTSSNKLWKLWLAPFMLNLKKWRLFDIAV